MLFFKSIGKAKSSGGTLSKLMRIIMRFLQFVLAVTVAGIYGTDLGKAANNHLEMKPQWVYAVVVAGISASTACLYGILLCLQAEIFFAWDWVVFLLWTILFGIFGRMFISVNPATASKDQIRMQNAVWIDLINMIFWMLTAAYATYLFFHERAKKGSGKGEA